MEGVTGGGGGNMNGTNQPPNGTAIKTSNYIIA
jgi:hypothetical protein